MLKELLELYRDMVRGTVFDPLDEYDNTEYFKEKADQLEKIILELYGEKDTEQN